MNKKINNCYAFTFVELIIVIVILIILSVIGFINYSSNVSSTRNTARVATLESLMSYLKKEKQDKGIYPLPYNTFNITNSGKVVAKQGFFNRGVLISSIDSIPTDPYKDNDYLYSTTRQQSEMQLSATLEEYGKFGAALLVGDYKTVSKNVLPTIMLAINSTIDIEIHDGVGAGSNNRKLFIFNKNIHNIPYDFDSLEAYSDGTDFSTLLADAENNDFIQNSDYRTCTGIFEENKNISDSNLEEYQVVTNGALTNTGCTF